MTFYIKTAPCLSNFRTISGVAVLVRLMEQYGISPDTILSGSHILPEDVIDPNFIISVAQELNIIKNVLQLSAIPEIGLIAGQNGHIAVNGKLGMALTCCNNLQEAISMAFQFTELTLTFFQHELKLSGNNVIHNLSKIKNQKPLEHFIAERELASIIRIFCDVLGVQFKPKEIHFAFGAPEYYRCYDDFFHCPVFFNAKTHSIVFDKHYLSCPLPKSDSLMKKSYEKELIIIQSRYKTKATLKDLVRETISYSNGTDQNIERTARQLGMSSRTLRRKLTTEGTSFQKIIDAVRKQEAFELLTGTNYSVEEIAVQTGYSNTSNFYHAFRRWTGKNPGDFRKKIHTENFHCQ